MPVAGVLRALSVCARLESLGRKRVQAGVVRGAFSRAVYLRTGGLLVTVTVYEQGNLPNGVLLPASALHQLSGLQPGTGAVLGAGNISFPDWGLIIDLTQAARWTPGPVRAEPVGPEVLKAGLGVLRRELTAAHTGDGLAPLSRFVSATARPDQVSRLNPYCRRAWPVLSDIMARWESGRLGEAAMETRKLVGLGPGLTPSGDDFVLGMMAALWVGVSLNPRLADRLRQVIRHMGLVEPGRTTEVSMAFLREAALGRMPEKLLALAGSLAAADRERTAARIRELMSLGATSGGDMAAGVLFGGHLLLKPGVLFEPERG